MAIDLTSFRFDTSTDHVSSVIVRAPHTRRSDQLKGPRSADWGPLSDDFASDLERHVNRHLSRAGKTALRFISTSRKLGRSQVRRDAASYEAQLAHIKNELQAAKAWQEEVDVFGLSSAEFDAASEEIAKWEAKLADLAQVGVENWSADVQHLTNQIDDTKALAAAWQTKINTLEAIPIMEASIEQLNAITEANTELKFALQDIADMEADKQKLLGAPKADPAPVKLNLPKIGQGKKAVNILDPHEVEIAKQLFLSGGELDAEQWEESDLKTAALNNLGGVGTTYQTMKQALSETGMTASHWATLTINEKIEFSHSVALKTWKPEDLQMLSESGDVVLPEPDKPVSANANLIAQVESIGEQIAELEPKLADLQAEFDEAQLEMGDLKKEEAELFAEVEELKLEISQLEHEEDKAVSKFHLDLTEQQHFAKREQIASKEHDLESIQNELGSTDDEIFDLTNRKASLEKELKNQQKEAEQAEQAETATLEAAVVKANKIHEEVKAQLEANKQKQETLGDELAQLQDKAHELTVDLADLDSEQSDLNFDLAGFSDDIEIATKSKAQLEKQLASLKAEGHPPEDLIHIESAITGNENIIAEKQAQMAPLKEQIKQKLLLKEILQTDLESAEADVDSALGEMDTLQDEEKSLGSSVHFTGKKLKQEQDKLLAKAPNVADVGKPDFDVEKAKAQVVGLNEKMIDLMKQKEAFQVALGDKMEAVENFQAQLSEEAPGSMGFDFANSNAKKAEKEQAEIESILKDLNEEALLVGKDLQKAKTKLRGATITSLNPELGAASKVTNINLEIAKAQAELVAAEVKGASIAEKSGILKHLSFLQGELGKAQNEQAQGADINKQQQEADQEFITANLEAAAKEDASRLHKLMDGFQVQWGEAQGTLAEVVDGHLQKLEGFSQRDLDRQFETVLGVKPGAGVEGAEMLLEKTSGDTVFKMQGIGFTGLDEISQIVHKGFLAGTSTAVLAKQINKRTGVAMSRARFIARNEMGNMYAAMTELKQTELGIFEYIWRTSEDERVRDDHRELNGTQHPWTNPPPVGHPGQDFNCRCTAEAVFPDDLALEEGESLPPEAHIARLRDKAGLSQRELGDMVGKSASWVGGVENGRQNARPEDLALVKQAFARAGVPIDDLERAFAGIEAEMAVREIAGEVPEAEPAAAAVGVDLSKFPEPSELGRLELVQDLGGSTGAELVRDPETGKQYVRKRGNSAAHIAEEALANDLYRVLGVRVPDSRFYADEVMTLAEFIPGLKKLDLTAHKEAGEGFVADALFANWDVAGLALDNMSMDAEGNVWRIDNGGSLRYRAQGSAKGSAWDEHISELWILRDPNRSTAAKVFGKAPGIGGPGAVGVSFDDIMLQGTEVLRNRQQLIATIMRSSAHNKTELADQLNQRLDTLAEYVQTGRSMRTDGWDRDYADGFTQQRAQIRKFGLQEAMPEGIQPTSGGGTWKGLEELNFTSRETDRAMSLEFKDENGVKWDKLRGPGSAGGPAGTFGIMDAYAEYLKEAMLDVDVSGGSEKSGDLDFWVTRAHSSWASAQGGGSWSGKAQAVKYWLQQFRQEHRDANGTTYYWRGGESTAKSEFEALLRDMPDPADMGSSLTKEQVFDRTFQAFHAFNYEMMKKADIPTKSADGNFLTIVRTENTSSVLSRYGMDRVGAESSGKDFVRGPLESSSMFRSVYVAGDSVVFIQVPLHRVFATYMPSKHAGTHNRMLLGDHENEILAITESAFNKTMMVYNRKAPISDWIKALEGPKAEAARKKAIWEAGNFQKTAAVGFVPEPELTPKARRKANAVGVPTGMKGGKFKLTNKPWSELTQNEKNEFALAWQKMQAGTLEPIPLETSWKFLGAQKPPLGLKSQKWTVSNTTWATLSNQEKFDLISDYNLEVAKQQAKDPAGATASKLAKKTVNLPEANPSLFTGADTTLVGWLATEDAPPFAMQVAGVTPEDWKNAELDQKMAWVQGLMVKEYNSGNNPHVTLMTPTKPSTGPQFNLPSPELVPFDSLEGFHQDIVTGWQGNLPQNTFGPDADQGIPKAMIDAGITLEVFEAASKAQQDAWVYSAFLKFNSGGLNPSITLPKPPDLPAPDPSLLSSDQAEFASFLSGHDYPNGAKEAGISQGQWENASAQQKLKWSVSMTMKANDIVVPAAQGQTKGTGLNLPEPDTDAVSSLGVEHLVGTFAFEESISAPSGWGTDQGLADEVFKELNRAGVTQEMWDKTDNGTKQKWVNSALLLTFGEAEAPLEQLGGPNLPRSDFGQLEMVTMPIDSGWDSMQDLANDMALDEDGDFVFGDSFLDAFDDVDQPVVAGMLKQLKMAGVTPEMWTAASPEQVVKWSNSALLLDMGFAEPPMEVDLPIVVELPEPDIGLLDGKHIQVVALIAKAPKPTVLMQEAGITQKAWDAANSSQKNQWAVSSVQQLVDAAPVQSVPAIPVKVQITDPEEFVPDLPPPSSKISAKNAKKASIMAKKSWDDLVAMKSLSAKQVVTEIQSAGVDVGLWTLATEAQKKFWLAQGQTKTLGLDKGLKKLPEIKPEFVPADLLSNSEQSWLTMLTSSATHPGKTALLGKVLIKAGIDEQAWADASIAQKQKWAAGAVIEHAGKTEQAADKGFLVGPEAPMPKKELLDVPDAAVLELFDDPDKTISEDAVEAKKLSDLNSVHPGFAAIDQTLQQAGVTDEMWAAADPVKKSKWVLGAYVSKHGLEGSVANFVGHELQPLQETPLQPLPAADMSLISQAQQDATTLMFSEIPTDKMPLVSDLAFAMEEIWVGQQQAATADLNQELKLTEESAANLKDTIQGDGGVEKSIQKQKTEISKLKILLQIGKPEEFDEFEAKIVEKENTIATLQTLLEETLEPQFAELTDKISEIKTTINEELKKVPLPFDPDKAGQALIDSGMTDAKWKKLSQGDKAATVFSSIIKGEGLVPSVKPPASLDVLGVPNVPDATDAEISLAISLSKKPYNDVFLGTLNILGEVKKMAELGMTKEVWNSSSQEQKKVWSLAANHLINGKLQQKVSVKPSESWQGTKKKLKGLKEAQALAAMVFDDLPDDLASNLIGKGITGSVWDEGMTPNESEQAMADALLESGQVSLLPPSNSEVLTQAQLDSADFIANEPGIMNPATGMAKKGIKIFADAGITEGIWNGATVEQKKKWAVSFQVQKNLVLKGTLEELPPPIPDLVPQPVAKAIGQVAFQFSELSESDSAKGLDHELWVKMNKAGVSPKTWKEASVPQKEAWLTSAYIAANDLTKDAEKLAKELPLDSVPDIPDPKKSKPAKAVDLSELAEKDQVSVEAAGHASSLTAWLKGTPKGTNHAIAKLGINPTKWKIANSDAKKKWAAAALKAVTGASKPKLPEPNIDLFKPGAVKESVAMGINSWAVGVGLSNSVLQQTSIGKALLDSGITVEQWENATVKVKKNWALSAMIATADEEDLDPSAGKTMEKSAPESKPASQSKADAVLGILGSSTKSKPPTKKQTILNAKGGEAVHLSQQQQSMVKVLKSPGVDPWDEEVPLAFQLQGVVKELKKVVTKEQWEAAGTVQKYKWSVGAAVVHFKPQGETFSPEDDLDLQPAKISPGHLEVTPGSMPLEDFEANSPITTIWVESGGGVQTLVKVPKKKALMELGITKTSEEWAALSKQEKQNLINAGTTANIKGQVNMLLDFGLINSDDTELMIKLITTPGSGYTQFDVDTWVANDSIPLAVWKQINKLEES